MEETSMIIDTAALAGVREMAAHFETPSQTICNWAARYHDFPDPVVDLAMGRAWDLNEVVSWYNDRWATDVADKDAVASV